MKKRTTIIILLLSISINSFSQERVNRKKIEFLEKSEKLEKAKGWSYNSEIGEWIEYENVICQSKDWKTKYQSLLGKYMMSHFYQNFTSIQTKSLEFESKKYKVLIIKKWQGRYEYPSIREDWYEWKETFGYIFTEKEYEKIKNIESETELKTTKSISLGSAYEKFDEVKFLDLIQTELKNNEKSYFTVEYKFPLRVVELDSKKFVRFYLPENSRYIEEDFEKEYFETEKTEFEKIILK